ncbi:MAG: nuclear transport factor 2 family protein [Gammaproteobacteria bacterium]
MSIVHKKTAIAAALSGLFAASVVLAASINPPTTPQTSPAMNAKEKANLDMVLDWWRLVIENGHLETTGKYQAVDYIQHNPSIATGQAAFVDFFKNVVKVPEKNPIAEKLQRPPVVAGAKGDFVFLVFETERKNPNDASQTYHSNSFEILRIENGKVQEHWDSAKRAKLPDGAPKRTFVQPKSSPERGSTGTLTAEEKRNLDVGTMELKDMLQYGHLELADKVMDPGYLQHNPNVPQGRDGFKAYMAKTPGRTPQEIKPEWKNPPLITLVSGPYVAFMWERKDKDPNDPSQEYAWSHFDVIRVEGGLIKEHWDEAVIAPKAP